MSISESLQARAVQVNDTELIVHLFDGTRHTAPISLFPILADATPHERASYELIAGNTGMYWPDLDEHVSVFSVVYPEQTIPIRTEAAERHIARNRERRSRTV